MFWTNVCDTHWVPNTCPVKADYFRSAKSSRKHNFVLSSDFAWTHFGISLVFLQKSSFDPSFRLVLENLYSLHFSIRIFEFRKKSKSAKSDFTFYNDPQPLHFCGRKQGPDVSCNGKLEFFKNDFFNYVPDRSIGIE